VEVNGVDIDDNLDSYAVGGVMRENRDG
jgi:hypothetical protein